jgi:hypothetical protein
MMQPQVIQEEYRVMDGPIGLSVVVGNAQFGLIDVRFQGSQTPLERRSNSVTLDLGQGEDLIGKTLMVGTVVSDVNPSTNRMIVTHVLSGGPENEVFIMRGEVQQANDFLLFRAEFTFTEAGA